MRRRRKSNHKVVRSKHDKCIDDVINAHFRNKPYILKIEKNVDYPLGEVDGNIYFVKPYVAYIEVKSNDTKKGYLKAKYQTQRWAWYQKRINPNLTYLMFYYAGNTKKLEYLGKNGIFRNNLD